jgi:hypothetical protein
MPGDSHSVSWHVVDLRCSGRRVEYWIVETEPPGDEARRLDGAREFCYPAASATDDGRRTTDDGRRTTDDGRRTTDDGRRTTLDRRSLPVLAAARNLVSALRLLDVLAIFGDDDRVRIEWTLVPGSRFAAETEEFLVRLGFRPKPWDEACATEYRLIIATSGNGDLFRLNGPLMLLPHGAGYSRVLGPGNAAPAGLAPGHEGRVLPRIIGLEHENQRARLAAYCPDAAPRGFVLGDPTRDRLDAGVRLRETYRYALGVSREQRLVVLSSTWGPGSLLSAHADLPARLLAELPIDEFQLASVIHPNIAARIGRWEVGRLLSRAREAGLRLIDPEEWESAILAADLLVGDHGSVSLYAAAAGTRVVFGAFDAAQIVPDSPMAELAEYLPRLRFGFGESLVEQLRDALDQDLNGIGYAAARASMGVPGESLSLTQTAAYELIGLEKRPAQAPRVRAPKPTSAEPPSRTSHLVAVARDEADPGALVVRRFGAAVDPEFVNADDDDEYRHLAVETTELDLSLRENAQVLIAHAHDGSDLKQVLADYRTCCRVAARETGPGTCLVLTAATGLVELRAADVRVDPAVLASVLWTLVQSADDDPSVLARLKEGVPIRVGRIRTLVSGQPCEPSPCEPGLSS